MQHTVTTFTRADRLDQLPPYLFADIDRKRRAAIAAGKDVINLGVGDPDQPTPSFIIDRLAEAARDPATHQYPPGAGIVAFRRACAQYLERRFGVRFDADRNISMLIGSKEGIGHLPLAVVNPGETVLIPQPGYPVYVASTLFAGAIPHIMPLTHERGWLPDFDAVPGDVARAAKLMFLNYPNNPTAAVADLGFYERAVAFARKHDIILAHDAAYCDMFYQDKPPSVFEIPGAVDCAVEFHSLSKTFNMTGWRIGFAAGHPEVVSALAKLKENLDSGQFPAIQLAAAEALQHTDHVSVRAMTDMYRERRDVVVDGLLAAGVAVDRPRATFYVWARCPDGYTSLEFATKVFEQAHVVVIPGVGFGAAGEGFFRIALTVDTPRLGEALERINRARW